LKEAPLLDVRDLTKLFKSPRGVVRAVDGVSFRLEESETVGLVGESGSGKSTVGYMIMGIVPPTSGTIRFKGAEIPADVSRRPRQLKKNIQIVFQDPQASLNPRRSIRRTLELPLSIHMAQRGRQRRQAVNELLRIVQLSPEYAYKSPTTLSGGEKARVAIARALASQPEVVVLDEPTAALDVSIQAKIINMLVDLQREMELSYVFISHDMSLMRNVASRIAIMYLGRLCELAPTRQFFETPLHQYTKMLLSSIPVISREEEELRPAKVSSEGEIPSPVNVPSGCRFRTRCQMATEICQQEDPLHIEVEPGHHVWCHLLSTGEKKQGKELR